MSESKVESSRRRSSGSEGGVDERGDGGRSGEGRRRRRSGEKRGERRRSRQPRELVEEACEGTVKWFSLRKGYGFIKRTDKEDAPDVYVNRRSIPFKYANKTHWMRSVGEGETVEFQLAKDRKGKEEAVMVSGPGRTRVHGHERARTKQEVYAYRKEHPKKSSEDGKDGKGSRSSDGRRGKASSDREDKADSKPRRPRRRRTKEKGEESGESRERRRESRDRAEAGRRSAGSDSEDGIRSRRKPKDTEE